MAKYETYYIECLKHDIEKRFGRTYKSPSDFKLLELQIAEISGDRLSESTLRRIWGYSKSNGSMRLTTLTILARTLGHIDWDAYVVDLMRHNRIESGFITANYLNVADFHPGDIVNFTWNPDREATLKYLGEYRFEVLDQRNSKLMAGDIFKLMFLREGAPVYCTDLRREGMSPTNYVAGESNGIFNLRYFPCGDCDNQ